MDGSAEGILVLETQPDGSLAAVGLAAEAVSPSFLAVSGQSIIAVEEGSGSVVSFERGDGFSLTPTSRASSGGSAPCHIGVYGDTLLISNYTDGVVGVLDTQPLALTQRLEATGSGPHPAQDGPHAHSTLQLADGRILSADLGADRLHVHTLGSELTRVGSVELAAGTGPRDTVQLSDGRILVLGELGGVVLVVEASGDSFAVTGTVDIPGAIAGDHAAGLSVTDDESTLFVALRGSNRIAAIGLSSELSAIGWVSSEGDFPRHHALDGNVLHVANQKSSTVASFTIAPGELPRLIAPPIAVPSPTYLLRLDS